MRLVTEEYYVNEILVSTFYLLHTYLSWELHITSYQPSRTKHPLKSFCESAVSNSGIFPTA